MDDAPLRKKVKDLVRAAAAPRGDKPSIIKEIADEMYDRVLEDAKTVLKKGQPKANFNESMFAAIINAVAKSSTLLLIQGRIQAKLLAIAFDSLSGDAWAQAMNQITKLSLEDLELRNKQ